MAISDVRYGAQVRTGTGRVVTFDAVECLASYIQATPDGDREGVWVADYLGSGMVAADSALYVLGGSLHSPMGRQLTSFAPGVTRAGLAERYGGRVLTWEEVLELEPTRAVTGTSAESAEHQH